MTRTFRYEFDPAQEDPIGGQDDVELTVQEIEDAGLREVLQTPGAALGSWAILDALLEPTGDGTPFVFRRPLGEAREVKVALSGLFGRFVARAYLERYFHLPVFVHLGHLPIVLDGPLHIVITRCASGDLPDWVACKSDLSDLTVAEAKGSSNQQGPRQALERAWKQAQRVDVLQGGCPVTVKRLAIVTRWGVATGEPLDPQMSVRDPIDEGEPISREVEDAIYVGLFRHHLANLLTRLGHAALPNSLRHLASADSDSDERLELTRYGGDITLWGEESTMPKTRAAYPLEFRGQMIELVRAGRSPEALGREFEPSAQAIRNWVRQADRDAGRRADGLTTAERREMQRLRRENATLREEREILKKAAAWFARETGAVPSRSSRSSERTGRSMP